MFLALSLVFAVRLVQLTVVDAGKNADAAADSRTVSITLAPKRGTIYDRNGNVLATSVDAKTVYCNPRDVTDADWEAEQIASALGGESKRLQKTSHAGHHVRLPGETG